MSCRHSGRFCPESGAEIGADRRTARCPCPFTNTLANHGYIPRNGLNVSGDVVLAAFDEVFNIDQSFTIGPVTNALSVSTTGINGTFNLPDVNIHNCMPIHPFLLIIKSGWEQYRMWKETYSLTNFTSHRTRFVPLAQRLWRWTRRYASALRSILLGTDCQPFPQRQFQCR